MGYARAVNGCVVVVALIVASTTREPATAAPVPKIDPLTVKELADAWLPDLKDAKTVKSGAALDYDDKAGVAAHTFDVKGASFEDVWNFYAAKCGTKHRFDKKVYHAARWTGAKDSPSSAIMDRQVNDHPVTGQSTDRLSSFTYRDRTCVVTVTIYPKGDVTDTILGTLTVVLHEVAK